MAGKVLRSLFFEIGQDFFQRSVQSCIQVVSPLINLSSKIKDFIFSYLRQVGNSFQHFAERGCVEIVKNFFHNDIMVERQVLSKAIDFLTAFVTAFITVHI